MDGETKKLITRDTMIPIGIVTMIISAVVHVSTAFANSANDHKVLEELKKSQEELQQKYYDDLSSIKIDIARIKVKLGVNDGRGD